jgi:hypothetical protein
MSPVSDPETKPETNRSRTTLRIAVPRGMSFKAAVLARVLHT